jgi:nitroimidazol reductase NimA-like FMN-containing flavoprotein (pyridoxamine 5'-phosphate oxidase superfamily)
VLDAILDEGLICHVGFNDNGATSVIPTTYARMGDALYLHGAAANHMLLTLTAGVAACLTVTLIDGLVLSRSAFHHSMNYRSVVLFGTATEVVDPTEKHVAVLAIVDHMAPSRSTDVRPPTPRELQATRVVRFPIEEGSAKIRSGGPIEEPEDLALRVWAGELPLALVAQGPVPDDGILDGVPVPSYLSSYSRRREAVRSTHMSPRRANAGPEPGG